MARPRIVCIFFCVGALLCVPYGLLLLELHRDDSPQPTANITQSVRVLDQPTGPVAMEVPDGWREATQDELLEVLFPSQFDSDVGNCSYDFKHACLGRARGTRRIPTMAKIGRLRASQIRTKDGKSDQHALQPLERLLLHLAATPPCQWTFVGDSTTSDSFVATLLGAMRLGWEKAYWCGQFGATYMHGENTSLELLQVNCSRFSKIFTQIWMVKFSHPQVSLHPQCKRLRLLLHVLDPATERIQQQRAELLVKQSTFLTLNWGVRKNDKQRLTESLDEVIKPFMDIRQFNKILWRKTLPQHFLSHDGSGLFTSARSFRKSFTCGPVTDRQASDWRNIHFSEWLQDRLGPRARLLRQVDANEYFLERHDLHAPPDCTHFLYSPFAYFHLWEAFREALHV